MDVPLADCLIATAQNMHRSLWSTAWSGTMLVRVDSMLNSNTLVTVHIASYLTR